ncbi:Replication factor A protein 2 [Batrachochytrium dendrobatidis]
MSFGGYGGYNGSNGYQPHAGMNAPQQSYQSSNNVGGGFLAGGGSSTGQYGISGSGNSPMVDSPNKKKGSGNQSLRPVTIKQLLAATQTQQTSDSPFTIDSQELTQVTLVGRLNSTTLQSTNCTYVIDDGTGLTIECKKFFDYNGADDEKVQADQFPEESYVQVFGQIKSFGSKKTLSLFKMRLINSIDEITYHNTMVIMAHLALTKGLNDANPNTAGFGTGAQHGGMMAGIKPQETQSGYLQQQYGQYGQQSNSGYGQSNDSMFTPIQSEILNFAREHQASVEGMAIKDLIFRMRGRASESQIREEVQFLSNEGHIYSTLDDDHFKSTGGN